MISLNFCNQVKIKMEPKLPYLESTSVVPSAISYLINTLSMLIFKDRLQRLKRSPSAQVCSDYQNFKI